MTNGSTGLGGLVLEQDFILQVRRLQKHGQPVYVFNIQLAQLPALAGKRDLMDATQDRLHEIAQHEGGDLYLMSNGDAFIVVAAARLATREEPIIYASRLVTAALPAGMDPGRSPIAFIECYTMPDDYGLLRERANVYVELVKATEELQADSPETLLRGDDVRGPLTAYSLAQIERLLDDLDVTRYLRGQLIYRRESADTWRGVYQENHVATGDLQQDKFPKLELRTSGRLFGELASMLDRRTLSAMMRLQDQWQGRTIGLNLSAGTVLSSVFAQFCHVVHGPARQNVIFELNIGELFHDLEKFTNAVGLLTREGFRVVLDGVEPGMLPFLNLSALTSPMAVSHIKLSVDRANARLLSGANAPAAIAAALASLPPERLIFMHVDSPDALSLGVRLGVRLYQGFHIDELVASLGQA